MTLPARSALVLLLLPLISCTSLDPAMAPPAASSYQADSEADHTEVERKLVKTGSQSVEVRNVEQAVFETGVIVKSHKGCVESSTIREDEEASLEIRVPAHSLTTILTDLAQLGDETFRRVRVDDRTRNYIDLEAEVTNLRALRTRLRALLAEAKSVEDALKVEQELARVQTRLDTLESQLRALKSQVTYSRVSLTLERKRTPGPLGVAGKAVALSVKKLFVLN